jgi:hypothetical protein
LRPRASASSRAVVVLEGEVHIHDIPTGGPRPS